MDFTWIQYFFFFPCPALLSFYKSRNILESWGDAIHFFFWSIKYVFFRILKHFYVKTVSGTQHIFDRYWLLLLHNWLYAKCKNDRWFAVRTFGVKYYTHLENCSDLILWILLWFLYLSIRKAWRREWDLLITSLVSQNLCKDLFICYIIKEATS